MAGEEIDYLVVGHVTQDVGAGDPRLGGTAFYAALTALRLGRRVGIVTCVTDAMRDELAEALPGVRLHTPPTERATTFENRYDGDRREQRLLWRAGQIGEADMPTAWRNVPLVHLAPVAQEVDPVLLTAFDAQFLGVTPQGWLRGWDDAGTVRAAPLPFEPARLATASAVVFSDEDVEDEGQGSGLTGVAPFTVQTRAGAPAVLHTSEGLQAVAACPTTVVDPTGAGDVFATAFFVRLAGGAEPVDAVRFAHVAAALAIGQEGHVGIPSHDQIETHMKRHEHGTAEQDGTSFSRVEE